MFINALADLARNRPFNTGNSLLEYTVQPGTYQFRIVNSIDPAALLPSLTAGQLGTVFTAWTFNTPFITNYLVFDIGAATNPTQSQLLAGAISPSTSGSAAAAYALAKTNGFYNRVLPLSHTNDDDRTPDTKPKRSRTCPLICIPTC